MPLLWGLVHSWWHQHSTLFLIQQEEVALFSILCTCSHNLQDWQTSLILPCCCFPMFSVGSVTVSQHSVKVQGILDDLYVRPQLPQMWLLASICLLLCCQEFTAVFVLCLDWVPSRSILVIMFLCSTLQFPLPFFDVGSHHPSSKNCLEIMLHFCVICIALQIQQKRKGGVKKTKQLF